MLARQLCVTAAAYLAAMAHALDGVYAKLDRADAHLETVREAINPIIQREPDLIPGEFDFEATKYVFRAQRDAEDPGGLVR